ncbi:MAG: glutamine--tRNA ligase/YqeY domain fusion protein [Phycisphaerales bacterium]
MTATEDAPAHFIRRIIETDNASGKWGGQVRTRFPPEPNGFLHIGHAKSICLNFGLAERYNGSCNLRFDDTNPAKEEQRYVDSITNDVQWLGFDFAGQPRFASDYFETMYDYAVELIRKGKAYVDDQNAEQIRESRGTLKEPGTPSPHRDRSVEENLDLFEKMRTGEFPDGSKVLRAKIDMASPNINLRDPVMYRVLNAHHHRTGDAWHIYPMYDWAHGIEDSIEGITHSICTLEFEDHRPLYDWFIEAINEERGPGSEWGEPIVHPQQIEFAKLRPTYTVMSKRNLLKLVTDGVVSGWDDPRMPTISGYRRRGYTPESIRNFCDEIGVTKFDAMIDIGRLENAAREHLNKVAPRRMAVLDPIKVTITNWGDGGDEGRTEWLEAVNNPEDPSAGSREVPFTKTLYIERDDFMEDAPRKFFRLKPGGEVRLRYGYWISCHEVVKDDAGNIVELRCTYDPQTRGGDSPPPDAEGNVRKVKGTLHWVSADHAVKVEVRQFDRLFSVEKPDRKPKDAGDDWTFFENLNRDSLQVLEACYLEPNWKPGANEASFADGITRVQFERQGYFCLDDDSTDEHLVFNRTVSLKDSWAKQSGKG